MKQFGEMMALTLETGGWESRFAHEGFDWGALRNATTVDMSS